MRSWPATATVTITNNFTAQSAEIFETKLFVTFFDAWLTSALDGIKVEFRLSLTLSSSDGEIFHKKIMSI